MGFFVRWQHSSRWNHSALVVFQHINQLTGVLILAAFSSKRRNRELLWEAVMPPPAEGETEMLGLSMSSWSRPGWSLARQESVQSRR